ncbi:MAG TPA: MFS transporter [Candidatus Sulfotelmatobacter sp.]|nr:MFS transporter [Candidatus Sulfotelmatobacter sp.]
MAATQTEPLVEIGHKLFYKVLAAISICHLVNDMLSSLLPAIYPLLKASFNLNFAQVGLITLTYQTTASLLQPMIGYYTDKKPRPFSLPVGMGATLIGLLLLAAARSFPALLVAAALVGTGSSVFHPESSRVARMASGGQHGLAQSIFQVGGNTGLSLGPLLAAFFVLPRGQNSLAWFSLAALIGMVLLTGVSIWARNNRETWKKFSKKHDVDKPPEISSGRIAASVAILMALLFSKFVYLASLTSYYTFYLISKFQLSVESAQVHLFVFLGAVAAGTLIGGPVGDRIGRKNVIWCSILGVLPFTLALPYANLFWTEILSVVIGLILASAFSVIVVYAQELMPGKVGMISGLCFGFAFGMAGLGAAVLGWLADLTSINFVYLVCSYLPAVGLLAAFLPNIERPRLQTIHEAAIAD